MNSTLVSRRNFLRASLAAGAAAAAYHTQLSVAAGSLVQSAQPRLLLPVKVARNRLIRTVVGLRPFRSEGFVVSTERLGRKLLVHNYGHGGAGVTLSWGTATLALDLARDFVQTAPVANQRRRSTSSINFAVLGCGVSGLTTALLLQRRFRAPANTFTIYAKELPPNTVSNVAGAWWSPTTVYDASTITTQFADQFYRACRISNRAFQELVGPEYGVKWIETVELYRDETSLQDELTGGNDLYPQIEIDRDPANRFGYPVARRFYSMIIEPHTYLRALTRDFLTAGGKIVVREFRTREEVARLPEQIVFNCTGLGSRALMNDDKLFPVRGQLEVLLPQPEIDYCYLAGGAYMFPRRDGIVLGGTWNRNDWSTEPYPAQTARIIASHSEIMRNSVR